MKPNPAAPIAARASVIACLMLWASSFALHAQLLISDRENYFPAEAITIAFSGGPGNAKDWVGIYPDGVTPGSVGSTIWTYVDGPHSGKVGLREGSITFGNGLNLAGVWNAYLLLNDGYSVLTNITFNIIDPTAPALRPSQRTYAPGQSITITFTNGPANPKDWVGVYKAGQTPGAVASTIWNYVDGTHTGAKALASGSVTFSTGLAAAGEYRAFFLLNDGYSVLTSEPITIATPVVSGPRLVTVSPADGTTNAYPDAAFVASITNGTSASVVTSSVVLKLDGAPVPASVTSASGLTTVAFTNASLLPAGSSHQYLLTYTDSATPAVRYSVTNAFVIRSYTNLVLPAPIAFENFDAVPEGEIPAGWTRKSYSDVLNTDIDFGNLDSAAYANWTAVDAARFNGRFITYSNPDTSDADATDYNRVNLPNPANVVNGKVLREPLAKGRFLFGDSGYRRGTAQVLYLYTPDFNLTGKTNIHVAFKSLWEQNQDSIAALEYSIDGGGSWMPVAYFLDGPDIVKDDNGVVDAEATFNTAHGDVANYTDDNGNPVGGTYGAFIAAPITPALAPYIQARVNDDPVESKRYELYRLPAADNQSKVRLRFAHAGTDSWYWGIDDVGVYSIGSTPADAPALSVERSGGTLRITWPATATGYVLESASTLSGATWTAVSGVSGSSVMITPATGVQFFRLRQP